MASNPPTEHPLPWRARGNKLVDAKGQTILVAFSENPSQVLKFILALVNAAST